MAACQHRYRHNRSPCPHVAAADAELCPWHNPRIDKSAPYVAESLSRILASEGTTDLEECHLVGVDWSRATLAEARLRGADLRDANLREADLRGADLRGAQLRRCDLRGAHLDRADLGGADLTDTQLGNAGLHAADLTDTLIEGTFLNGADLSQADVSGAAIESFYWNRLTRFSGIRGLEPRRDSGDATQRFVAPFALGDRDISESRRSSLSGTGPDSELERTRFFRSSQIERREHLMPAAAESRPRPAADSATDPATSKAVADPDLVRRVAVYRRANRQLLILVFACLVVAIAAGGLLASERFGAEPSDPPPASVDRRPDPERRPDPGIEAPSTSPGDLDFHRERIASLTGELEAARQRLEQAAARLRGHDQRAAELEQRIAVLQRDNAALRAHRDDWDELQIRYRSLEAEHRERLAETSRLERTARILNEGLRDLTAENERLRSMVSNERLDRITLANRAERIETLEAELAEARRLLDREREARASLELDLGQAEQAMSALAKRIEGTPLENLLGQGEHRAEPMPIEAGVPLVLGGDVLLTFTVERVSSQRVRCLLVVQGPTDQHLPDISVILSDRNGVILSRLGYSFDDASARPGFARAETLLDLDRFPATARIVATPDVDDALAERK